MVKYHMGMPFKGHAVDAPQVGWGEPPSYYPRCSCGWTGLTVQTKWWSDNDPDYSYFVEPYRTVAQKWGPEQIHLNEVYGNRPLATIQLLHHLNYDPQVDENQAQERFQAAVAGLRDLTVENYELAAERLKDAGDELVASKNRQAIWASTPLPQATDPIPEAQAILRAHEEAEKLRREQEASKPLTEKERAILQQAGVSLDEAGDV